MIIALVLVTAAHLPDPEQSLNDKRSVMTPVAFHHFPSEEYASARERAGLGHKSIHQIPSLVELLIHYFSSFKTIAGRPTFSDELEATHLWPFIRANKAFYHFYHQYNEEGDSKRSSQRTAQTQSQNPRTLYLSSATLVIVPPTLLSHWKTEIDKHCHDFVRYLIVRPSKDLPDARKLASEFDVSGEMAARGRND